MKNHVQPKKNLGQNFLLDQNIASNIVLQATNIEFDTTILEIGPGTGALTKHILKSPANKIIALEKDIRCVDSLKKGEIGSDPRLTIINCDAVSIDERTILTGNNNKIIANLPYNIGTALLIKWLDMLDLFTSITVMLQKEVAERIVAEHGNKKYGRLSVIMQLFCSIEKVIDVPREAFFPQPKVLSSVIHITPREIPLFDFNRTNLEKICAAAFSQRRKMIRSSLNSVFGNQTKDILNFCNIDEQKRAEELSIKEFCLLSNYTPN